MLSKKNTKYKDKMRTMLGQKKNVCDGKRGCKMLVMHGRSSLPSLEGMFCTLISLYVSEANIKKYIFDDGRDADEKKKNKRP
jgi:hypothetical protein